MPSVARLRVSGAITRRLGRSQLLTLSGSKRSAMGCGSFAVGQQRARGVENGLGELVLDREVRRVLAVGLPRHRTGTDPPRVVVGRRDRHQLERRLPRRGGVRASRVLECAGGEEHRHLGGDAAGVRVGVHRLHVGVRVRSRTCCWQPVADVEVDREIEAEQRGAMRNRSRLRHQPRRQVLGPDAARGRCADVRVRHDDRRPQRLASGQADARARPSSSRIRSTRALVRTVPPWD